MSLINQMLKDLDARNAPEIRSDGLHREVRRLPQEGGGRWRVLAMLGLLLAVVGGAAAYAWFSGAPLILPGVGAVVKPPAIRIAEAPPPANAPLPQTAPPPPLAAAGDPFVEAFNRLKEQAERISATAEANALLLTNAATAEAAARSAGTAPTAPPVSPAPPASLTAQASQATQTARTTPASAPAPGTPAARVAPQTPAPDSGKTPRETDGHSVGPTAERAPVASPPRKNDATPAKPLTSPASQTAAASPPEKKTATPLAPAAPPALATPPASAASTTPAASAPSAAQPASSTPNARGLPPPAPKKPASPSPGAGDPAVASESVAKTAPTRTARERSEAVYRHALALAAGGAAGEALDRLLSSLRDDGGHVPSRQLAARLLVEQGRREEAMALLAEGLAAQPGQVQWAMSLARLQVDHGDLGAAARTLQASRSFASANPEYLGFAGFVAHRLGKQESAVELYQSAARIAPADGRWWLGLGLALEAGQRPADAREAFLRARASGNLAPGLSTLVEQKLR